MPFVEAGDDYADPPRPFAAPRVPSEPTAIEVVDGYLALEDGRLDSSADFGDCEELELTNCVLDGVSFAGVESVRLRRCQLTTCDLTQTRIELLHSSQLSGCKLVGVNLPGAGLQDVSFENCALRYCNVRAANLTRIRFAECELAEVDFYDSTFANVAFPGSTLTKVNLDQARFKNVDLRGAGEPELTGLSDLRGVLISDRQVIALAYQFALAAGVSIAE